MKKKKWSGWIAALLCGCLLAGCGAQTEIDDYATNSVDGSDEQGTESSVAGDNTTSTGIPKDEIKVGQSRTPVCRAVRPAPLPSPPQGYSSARLCFPPAWVQIGRAHV